MTRRWALTAALFLIGFGPSGWSAPRRVFLRVIVVRERSAAEEALRLLRAGEDFAVLAGRISIHPSAGKGGYFGETWVERLNDDWRGAVSALKPGGLAGPLPYGYDWAILLRMPKDFAAKAYALQEEADRLVAAGKVRQAIPVYQKAIREYPDFIHAYFLLAVAHRKLGELDAEIAAYQAAVDLEPSYEVGFYNLGLALLRKGRPLEATVALQRAIRVKPDYTDCHASLSAAYLALDRIEDAIQAARAAIDSNPLRPEGYYNLGAAQNRRDPRAAVESFRLAVKLDSARPEFHMALAVSLAATGAVQEAASELRAMSARWPDFAPAREMLARIEGSRP